MKSIQNFCRYIHSNGPLLQLKYKEPVEKGFPKRVMKWLDDMCVLLHPKELHFCLGNMDDREMLIEEMLRDGSMIQLSAYKNCFLVRTDPRDSSVKDSNIFISGYNKRDWIPTTCENIPSVLGNFVDMRQSYNMISGSFNRAMRGRKMYVNPFVLGTPGSRLHMLGVQLTDSPFTALMLNMTHRVGPRALDAIRDNEDICLYNVVHCVGRSENACDNSCWPCDPDNAFILNIPDKREVWSYGSAFGANSILLNKAVGKHGAAVQGSKECWLAEQMAIFGIERTGDEKKKYIGVLGPEGCGKSTMATLLTTRMPHYRVTMISDDISWIKIDHECKKLIAINPERGVFSQVPGMNWDDTPIPMTAASSNTIFVNTASTCCGTVWWEGLEKAIGVTDWLGNPWSELRPSTSPNARFCTRLNQFINVDEKWDAGEGVELSAIMVGVRRSAGYPLLFEATCWETAVLLMGALRTESFINFDNPFSHMGELKLEPFGTKSFLGYNLAKYIEYWLVLNKLQFTLPKLFFFNLFQRDQFGFHIWPGYGENVRLLDWVYQRICGYDGQSKEWPMGVFPTENSFNLDGIESRYNLSCLLDYDGAFWKREVDEIENFFNTQMPLEVPSEICCEISRLRNLISSTPYPG